MAQDRLVPPTISVLGFAVLIIGSMGYMGVYAVNDAVSYTMMIIGIMAVIVGMLLMYRYDPYEHATRGGKDMGFIDKLKNAFKKKNKGEAAAAEPAAKKAKGAAKRSAQFTGEGKVADALRFAADKIDAKVEAGMSEKTAEIFFGGLKAIEADSADDDAKLIAISQVIGGIVNA